MVFNVYIYHIQNMVEETTKTFPWKTKKKMKEKDETGLNKTKARERTPSLPLKGRRKGECGLSNKNLHDSQKEKGEGIFF